MTKHVTVKFAMAGNASLQDIVAALELIGAKTDSINIDIKTDHGGKPPPRPKVWHQDLVYRDALDGKSRIDIEASLAKLGVTKVGLAATTTHKGTAMHALKVAIANTGNGHAQ